MAETQERIERVIAVRDSKDPDGVKLFFRLGAWKGLIERIKAGELELPPEFRQDLDERFARPVER
ncbi:MAG: DUF397 domain-containing protein [Actinoallomurus sp.]